MKVQVTVGGVSFGVDGVTDYPFAKTSGTTPVIVTFTGNATNGKVAITLTPNDTSKSMYLSSITIKTGESSGTDTPEDPDPEVTLSSISAVYNGSVKVGETVNKADFTVTATYSDSTTATVTDFTISTVDTTTATFEGVAAGTYEVTVVANPADATINTASEAGTASVTVEAAPAGETKSVEIAFPIEGAVSGNSVGTIYEGDLLISSTGSWRTDSADGRDCIYIGRTTSNELRIEAQNGKTITKVTLTAPVGYLVDLKAKEYDGYTTQTFASVTEAVWTGECASRIVWTAAGNSHSNIASIVVEYK